MLRRSATLTSLDIAILDMNSEYLGVSTLQLMENAGCAVADEIISRFGRGSSVVVYGATGKNGGDGMVAARHLAAQDFKVTFRLVGNSALISDDIVSRNWLALRSMSSTVKIEEYHDSSNVPKCESDVVVDALLGTGAKGRLRQPILKGVEAINSSAGFKVAVDVPSGVDSDTGEVLGEAVRANLTVTLHAMKNGLLRAKEFCGEIKVADIGIPPEAALIAGPGDVAAVAIRRLPEAHKGQFGRLLVIGGSEIFTGAPSLVALAAYRTGTDLVFIAAPENTANIIASISPNLITIKLPGPNLAISHFRLLREQLENASTIAIGPGLGLAKPTISAVRKIVGYAYQAKKPLLLDADGLKALGVIRKQIFLPTTVVTPHGGEFQAITGKAASRDLNTRSKEVREFAARSGAIVLLKGHTDIISDGDRLKLNNTGNPGMTVGGTGDVLSGIVAGLMAQGVDPFRAAVAGAFVNGAAGDIAADVLGYHLTPTDLLEHIPKVFNDPMSYKVIREKRL
ncbi:MAG: NAD(P)H-hydrate dehydratase [Candidatus Bathyarchaeia archaeon]